MELLKMITKLTDEQKNSLKEWREHCLLIGRNTDPINKDVVEDIWGDFYKILALDKPRFRYCQSPYQAQIIINALQNIRENIGENIGENIRENIGENIWENIWENIRQNIKENIGHNKFTFIPTYLYCQHDITWIAYYKYYEKYGLLPNDDNFDIIHQWYVLAQSCGWCYTFKNMVVVCEKPSEIYLNDRGQLHKDSGMALKYSDGYGLWMLNGINVPEWLVITDADAIDPERALTEENVDIQREIIRKIGAERILKKSNAKKLDTYKDNRTKLSYSLYHMRLNDNIDRKYLYFEHASIPGVFFCQPVPPETVKALHGLAWMRRMIERDHLDKHLNEAELIKNLPGRVA